MDIANVQQMRVNRIYKQTNRETQKTRSNWYDNIQGIWKWY